MPRRLLLCLLGISLAAFGQRPLTIQELISMVKSQQRIINEHKSSDAELANFLAKVKLSQKLEDSVIEDLQAAGAGPRSMRALEKLKEQSAGLPAPNLKQPLPDDPIAIPTSVQQAAILDEVRAYVMNYDSSLPDFICMEVETRKVAPRTGARPGAEPAFHTMDVITNKLTYFQHKEEKTPLLNGGRPTNVAYEKLGGSTSTGDFGAMLRALFDPATHARFEWARWTTWRDRLTMVFSFHVMQDRSQYTIAVKDPKRQITTAYSGEVYVDDENHKVMRLKTQAEDIPADFPIRRAETILNYEYSDVGGIRFLLPSRGEVQMEDTDDISDNILDFLSYRKYEVGSSISFDLPADLPAGQPDAKETAPIDCKDPKNKDNKACKKG